MTQQKHQRQDLRAHAIRIFQAGVAAADPAEAVRQALDAAPLGCVSGQTYVIAIGKAARRMAEAALCYVPPPREVLVVTNRENAVALEGAEVIGAGHPVPDESSVAGGRAVLRLLVRAGPQDQVLALISGGGSALVCAPAEGITLAEKADVNAALLASGADITQMNLVRQQLSRLKGGGMLRAAGLAPVRALILSDVVGNNLAAVASGPTVGPLGTRAQARAVLRDHGVWAGCAASVRARLDAPTKENAGPAGTMPQARNEMIGSNTKSVAAMAALTPGAHVFPVPLTGDVADAAAKVLAFARIPGIFLFGGETTVRLTGTGRGGRNQELALRVMLAVQQAGWQGDWVFLSGGTDGRDGPTDAAGGLVDGATLARLRAAGVDVHARLAQNDSYTALEASRDLLMTGPTGTNVADLQVLIRRR